jgi:hypothetical protein
MRRKKAKRDKELRNILLVGLGLGAVLLIYWAIQRPEPGEERAGSGGAPLATVPGGDLATTAETRVPPFHTSAEAAKPFPELLPAAYFRGTPLIAHAYAIAAEIPAVIAQQPCYCFCDSYGHRSLLDCYASDHGAG